MFDAAAGTRSEELFLVHAGDAEPHVVRRSAEDGKPSRYPDIAFDGQQVALTW